MASAKHIPTGDFTPVDVVEYLRAKKVFAPLAGKNITVSSVVYEGNYTLAHVIVDGTPVLGIAKRNVNDPYVKWVGTALAVSRAIRKALPPKVA